MHSWNANLRFTTFTRIVADTKSPLSQGPNSESKWFENTSTTWSKMVNGSRSAFLGLLATVFINSEKWKSIVIKTGSMGLQDKPVCTRQAMESWFGANSNGREAASERVRQYNIFISKIETFFKMQREFVKLRDNHRGRLRMAAYRGRVKVPLV